MELDAKGKKTLELKYAGFWEMEVKDFGVSNY